MPRDASGNYFLPIGNPVEPDTVIQSTWANTTMQDLALQLNNVITRDGLLGPVGPFRVADGTVSAPGLAFNSEPGLGWYRSAAGVGALVQGGSEVWRWNASDGATTVATMMPRGGTGASMMAMANTGVSGNGANLRIGASLIEGFIEMAARGTGPNLGLRIEAPTVIANGAWTFNSAVAFPGGVSGNADNALYVRSGATPGGAQIKFTWSDPGTVATYAWVANGPGDVYVRPISSFSVNYANSAGSAPANGGTSSNSNAVSGISGWNYSNRNYNPPYLWATAGGTNDQFLVTPGNLSVNYANSSNYANSAGSAPANGGTATNANHADRASNSDNSDRLAGQASGYFINNAGSAVVNIHNNGATQYISDISGFGSVFWGTSISDARLKEHVVPVERNSLLDIDALNFVGYNFRSDVLGVAVDDGSFHPVGIIAQDAEKIHPKWISHTGSWLQPDVYEMLMSTMHAVQQLYRMMK